MEKDYIEIGKILKAISDPKRLKIVDLLSCGELCGCDILNYFNITQPTLSHDMKVLTNSGIVSTRREGQNTYYALDQEKIEFFKKSLINVLEEDENCICHSILKKD